MFMQLDSNATLRGKNLFSVLLAVVVSMPAWVSAQQPLEEIIVTAQKREQSLQDVPISITAWSGDQLRSLDVQQSFGIARFTPGVDFVATSGGQDTHLTIRGVVQGDCNDSIEPPNAVYVDEGYIATVQGNRFALYDLERVEILRGPQGTLFGRNTNAGMIKIDSVAPTFETEGYASVAYGSRETAVLETAIGGALSDGVAARLSLKYQQRDNWIDNTVNGPGDDFGDFEEFAYRFQLLFQPGDTFRGLVKLHGFHQDSTNPQLFYANAIEQGTEGLRAGFDEEIASYDLTSVAGVTTDHFGGLVNLQWDFGDSKFTSITGYDTVENFQSTDVDGGLTSFTDPPGTLGRQLFFNVSTGDGLDEHYQFTQEFRFSNQGDRLFYQVGVFYFEEEIDILSVDFGAAPPFFSIQSQQTESAAVFGQVEYALSDAWSITGGARWTSDDKDLAVTPGPASFAMPDAISVDDDFFNWDLALTWGVSDDWSLYGRFANGSRGPVTIGRFGAVSSAETETTNSLEFGFKSTLLDGRARWNTAIYGYQNDDQQLTATGQGANINRLLNADQVNGKGVETDFDIQLTDNLFVSTNLSYNDTEIDDPELEQIECTSTPLCTGLNDIVAVEPNPFVPGTTLNIVSIDGNPLPRALEWMFNFILNYDVPLASGASIYFNTDWAYRSDAELFLYRSVEYVAEARWLGGVRLGFRTKSEKWDFAIVGRNITDEITVDGAIDFLNLMAFVNEPAYWGVEARYDW